jgi:hypothetical protein
MRTRVALLSILLSFPCLARADESGRHLRTAGIVTLALGAAAIVAGGAMIGHYTHAGCGDGQDGCLAAIPMGAVVAVGLGGVVAGIPMVVVGARRASASPALTLNVSAGGLSGRF